MMLLHTPRPHQAAFRADLAAALADTDRPLRRLYASPTGTGKSLMGILALIDNPGFVLVTPRVEILVGLLDKIGESTEGLNTDKIVELGRAYRIFTPIRFRNLLAKGTLDYRPTGIILDEAHHSEASTYQHLEAYLPQAHWVGLTATPYRGTPASTREFYQWWGDEIIWCIRLPEAAEAGYISIPDVEVWPLVDDEQVEVVGGEFQLRALTRHTATRLGDVVERCRAFVTDGKWDRPTLFSVPATETVRDLVERLEVAGLPAVAVIQDTPRAERVAAFAAAMDCRAALAQINVVSEGVDLPFRRLIDLSATLSPNRWLQQLGRTTRPGGGSIYICCNRNLERHCYLMEGMVPATKIAAAQKAFKTPASRSSSARMLEEFGSFEPAQVSFADGTQGLLYAVSSVEGFTRTEYAVLLHPCHAEPVKAQRISTSNAAGESVWGQWQQIDTLPSLRGFRSLPITTLTEKQSAWWKREAHRYGLDSTSRPSRRAFPALPLLKQLRLKVTA